MHFSDHTSPCTAHTDRSASLGYCLVGLRRRFHLKSRRPLPPVHMHFKRGCLSARIIRHATRTLPSCSESATWGP